jgi:hypothetical protein
LLGDFFNQAFNGRSVVLHGVVYRSFR